jgi:hypothetical protein
MRLQSPYRCPKHGWIGDEASALRDRTPWLRESGTARRCAGRGLAIDAAELRVAHEPPRGAPRLEHDGLSRIKLRGWSFGRAVWRGEASGGKRRTDRQQRHRVRARSDLEHRRPGWPRGWSRGGRHRHRDQCLCRRSVLTAPDDVALCELRRRRCVWPVTDDHGVGRRPVVADRVRADRVRACEPGDLLCHHQQPLDDSGRVGGDTRPMSSGVADALGRPQCG